MVDLFFVFSADRVYIETEIRVIHSVKSVENCARYFFLIFRCTLFYISFIPLYSHMPFHTFVFLRPIAVLSPLFRLLHTSICCFNRNTKKTRPCFDYI